MGETGALTPHVTLLSLVRMTAVATVMRTTMSVERSLDGAVGALLAAGTLVQLLPGLKREQHGYFITWRKNHAQDKLLRKIADWMVGEAGR